MSEIIISPHGRIQSLTDFARRLIEGENGNTLIESYRDVIETVTPAEAMAVLDALIVQGIAVSTVKANTGKIINVFFRSLSSFKWEKPAEDHFLSYLMKENRAVEGIIREFKVLIRKFYHEKDADKKLVCLQMLESVRQLKLYELHYIKKENILFPFIEKTFPQYRCLQVMWAFHDDYRQSLKALETMLSEGIPEKETLNRQLGKLFFTIVPVIFREEQIVFPVALRALPEKAWQEMLEQSAETGYCYIQQPDFRTSGFHQSKIDSGKADLRTGQLTVEQITLLFNHLPVDITFIDANDEVRYFSGGSHRIFPRSVAIIGRKVQNCHPPDSVHVVNEIVEAFREGTKDHADFWIQMGGRFIYIRYFAVRSEDGIYSGTIEVSQDVTDIRELNGEKRLLSWNDPS